jgi:hypothetical protein
MRSSLKARATRAPIGNLAMSSFASALELRRAAGAGRRVAFIGRRRSASTRCVFVFFSRVSDLFIPRLKLPPLSPPPPPQALLGFSRNLTHLDGHVVPLERKGVTQPGFVQTIKGEGMPHFENPSSQGDLFVEYNVVLPTQLSTQTRQRASNRSPSYKSICLPPLLRQVSLKYFMGKHIEIKTNYRRYCIPLPCISQANLLHIIFCI